MKKKIIYLSFLLISVTSLAQVTDVISNQFSGANDAVVEDDNMFIVDFLNGQIARVDLSNPNPSVQETFPYPDVFVLYVDGADAYVCDLFGTVTVVDTSDFSSDPTTLSTNTIFGAADMLRIGIYLYVSDLAGNALVRIDLSNPGTVENVLTGINSPQGLAHIGDELFIAISGDNTIGKIDVTQANPQLEIVVDTGLDTPSSLTSKDSMLYITEFSLSNGRVLSLDTSVSNPAVVELATSLSNPVGISIFENDVYFVQNGGNGALSRIENAILSINTQNELSGSIVLTPNPSNDSVIQLSNIGNAQIQNIITYDLTGRIVSQLEYNASSQYIDGTPVKLNISSGTYIVAITTDMGTIKQKLIVK